jgi:ribonuclease D
VLCSRERLEAIARRRPLTLEELSAMPELRRWQSGEMGQAFLDALETPVTGVGAVAKNEDAAD